VTDNHTVPSFGNDVFVYCPSIDREVDEIGRCSCGNWTFDAEDFSGNHFGVNLFIFEDGDCVGFEFLVLWLTVLIFPLQI